MEKLDFKFKEFKITYQPNNTNHLILVVLNDMAASILYPKLSMSTDVSLSYSITTGYFDLYITLNDTQEFFELNYNINDDTKTTGTAIDKKSVTDLWVAFYLDGKIVPYGTVIQLFYH